MRENLYKKSFNLFLKNTDEKSVILKFIKKNIKLNNKVSFLDVGGGDGTLAISLAKEVKATLVIEPNTFFVKKIKKNKNIEVINNKWENIRLEKKFDFILAAYVVTYFPQNKRKDMIKKMYKKLNHGGKIIILSVDAKKGSWRKIHTIFYRLMGVKRISSDEELKKIMKEYQAKAINFKTYVWAKNIAEMLNILYFDFLKYPDEFKKHKKELGQFLLKYSNANNNIHLEMMHNAYIITKK